MRAAVVMFLLVAGCSTEGGGSDPQTDAPVGGDAAMSADAHPSTPDAPMATVCASKDPVVQLIYTCDFQWKQCAGTSSSDHEVSCTIQAAGSLRFSLCECMVNGTSQQQFTSTTVCGLSSWPEVEAEANMRCGWNLQ